ncbi:M50 family metallopeptidase [Patescibacteria group bacterium]|nr:M50 family metallopeptidase [Patescibacteria group bacterium]
MFIAVVVFILVFSIVVFAHELGHLYFAKKMGVLVEEFGFGLPPRIWGKKRNGTIYSINLIPFGGFVKLYGEGDGFDKDPQAFINKKPWQKFLIVTGGVMMNFLLGWVVLMIGFWMAMPPLVTLPEQYGVAVRGVDAKVVVAEVLADSPAERAGILPGDYIISVDQVIVSLPSQIKDLLQADSSHSANLVIERDGQQQELAVKPIGKTGEIEMGVLIDREISRVHYAWWAVPWIALRETGRILLVVLVSILGLLKQIFTTATLPADLSGPVGIARVTADVVKLGLLRVLQFIVFLSINLGIINLVPFPALDGGRAVFALVEWLRGGKKVSSRIENAVNTVGFVALLWLLFVVTYKDILKLF